MEPHCDFIPVCSLSGYGNSLFLFLLVARILLCLHTRVCIDLRLRNRQYHLKESSVDGFRPCCYGDVDDVIVVRNAFVQADHIEETLSFTIQFFAALIQNHIRAYR